MKHLSSDTKDKGLEIHILTGEDALSTISKGFFVKEWEALLLRCGYGSVFQSPQFVIPWYTLSSRDFSPVVLAARNNGELVGMLNLSRRIHHSGKRHCNRLEGAGDYFSLYQTWLVEESFLTLFWTKGILRLLDQFPGTTINLKSIQGLGVFDALIPEASFKKYTALEKLYNPVLDFSHDGYDRIFAKRHFKSKINRLNRAGEVKLEKITTSERLAEVFPQISTFYALRHGAVFNKIPFYSFGVQLALFQAWLEQGALHFTCLWLNTDLIGGIVMVNDFGITAHLAGMITFSPTHGKFSPGLVHLYLHAQLLKEERFENLKLSPGYDAYKDRFSNCEEEVYQLLITKSKFQLFRRKSRIALRAFLLRQKIRPMQFDVNLSKVKSKSKHFLSRLFRARDEGLDSAQLIEHINQAQMNGYCLKVDFGMSAMHALLLAGDKDFQVVRWEFLEDALVRLEENQHCITFTKNDRLLACIWYVGEQISSEVQLLDIIGRTTKIFVAADFIKPKKRG